MFGFEKNLLCFIGTGSNPRLMCHRRLDHCPRLVLRRVGLGVLLGMMCIGENRPIVAQGIHVGVPFNSIGNSYYESTGVNWSWGIPGRSSGGTRIMGLTPQGTLTPNLNFSFHGGPLVPPFGNYHPNAGGRLDVRGRNFQLGLSMAKGSATWSTMQAPSLTVQNGFGGSIFSGQTRPFVTGWVPIVGTQSASYPDNAVTRAVQSGMLDQVSPTETPSASALSHTPTHTPNYSNPRSTATTGDISVAAIKEERARQLQQRNRIMTQLIEEANELLQEENESAKNKSIVRRKFLEALKYADDDQTKRELKRLADSLKVERRR